MSLTIGDTAPDFTAETTEGTISFHDWIGDSWAVLFSHPKDFTPICTTELGYMATIKPEFDRRGVKVMALSVDPIDKHAAWAADIEETQGTAPNYPMIGDTDFTVSKAYGMLGADVSGDPADRTAADNQTVRNVFVIGPDKKIKLIMLYPMTTGRNFDEILRVIDSLQLTAKHKVATPVNWKQGEDVVIAGSVSNDEAKEIFGSWTEPKPYIRIVPQPHELTASGRDRQQPLGRSAGGGMRILVLGAGFGGLELTTRLSDELGDAVDIVLIDKADGFVFGFSKLDVMFGRTTAEAVRHPYRDLVKPGVRFVQATIRSIDPEQRRVETDAGAFEADVMVVALGADLDPAATPGLVEAGHEFYTVDGAFAGRDVLETFEGGRVIVGVTSTPFKCPPAPSETALLLHDFLVERGLREASQISLVMPLGVPIPPSPAASEALLAAFAERGISWYPERLVAASTRSAGSRCSPTATRCPTTCSSACRSTGCPRWWPSRGCASTDGSRSTR